MKKALKRVVLVLSLLAVAGGVFYETQKPHHSAPRSAPSPVATSGDRVLDGIHRAVAYLETRQEEDGEFSAGLLDPKPAYTALVADALARAPEHDQTVKRPSFARALGAIVRHQQPDGGIYTPGLGLDGYCTAISLMALRHTGDPGLAPAIERARAYVASCQVDAPGSPMDGGFGYSKGASRADLSNTAMALEALKEAGLAKDDPALRRVQGFLDACHNDSETNKVAWASTDGGFVYRPGESKAGSFKDERGQERFRSYGLMSYAGLLSFLTAYVDRSDPRVRSSYAWVTENWDLETNRNLGQRGLFYYYLTMAKALAAYGDRTVKTKDGVQHDWARELARAILDRQRADGSWQNGDKTWFENDEVLVTAYMLRALSICQESGASVPAADTAAVGSR